MDMSVQDLTPVRAGETPEVSGSVSQRCEASAWWLTDPCPSWCAVDHAADEADKSLHAEDRSHVAPVAFVPVIRASSPPFKCGENLAEAAEYIVIMRRYVGQTDAWVYIGEGEDTSRAVEVTTESARRLSRAIAKVVG